MYLGILVDTNRFPFKEQEVVHFEAAAYLKNHGVDPLKGGKYVERRLSFFCG